MTTVPPKRHVLSIDGGVAPARASAWARGLAANAGLSEERSYALDLCIVELVTNVVDHGYGETQGVIRLELDIGPQAATLTILDDGPAFDPLSLPVPATPALLDDAPERGYGIQMVRSAADDCRYERRNGQNVFTAYFGAASPAGQPGELTLRADASAVPRASEWLEALCRERGVPEEPINRLLLCLDDALANVLSHGGPSALSGPIQLLFEMRVDPGSRTASVTLSDAGSAFDPVSAPDKPLPKTLEEAVPHGRGLQLIRACTTVLRYRREEGRNHLTFGTSWEAK